MLYLIPNCKPASIATQPNGTETNDFLMPLVLPSAMNTRDYSPCIRTHQLHVQASCQETPRSATGAKLYLSSLILPLAFLLEEPMSSDDVYNIYDNLRASAIPLFVA